MKQHVKIFVWVFLFIGALYFNPLQGLSQQVQDDILIKVNQSLSSLQWTVKNNQGLYPDTSKLPDVRKNLKDIDKLLNGMVTNILNTEVKDTAVYQMTLLEISNYKDLFDLSEKTKSLDSVNNLLAFISQDLKLKYGHNWASSSNISNEFVNVHIRVLDAKTGHEIAGYIAFVKPRYSVNPVQVQNFNPTNNAFKDILPGEKLFWIEKDGQIIGKKTDGILLNESHTADEVFTIN